MSLEPGARLLTDRFELFQRLSEEVDAGMPSQSWEAVDDGGSPYLVKAWPYDGDEPDDVQRALWDAELRTMYRLGSSPGADSALVTLRDAGVDRAARCFVMVLKTPGFESLAEALAERTQHPELVDTSPRARRDVWIALARIAAGLRLLHEQHVLHRNVCAESLFINAQDGLSSLRLGGFEWTVRLGVPASAPAPTTWSTPPERLAGVSSGWSLEDDWFGFGVVAARCLVELEKLQDNDPPVRHTRTLRAVESQSRGFSELERDLVMHLIAADPRERLTRAFEIERRIADIIATLDQLALHGGEDEKPLILSVDPNSRDLVDAAREAGFQPDPANVSGAFNPHDVEHVARLMRFLRDDLSDGQLHAVARRPFLLLVGRQMIVRVVQLERRDTATRTRTLTWDAARCSGPGELRVAEPAAAAVRDLPRGRLAPMAALDVLRSPRVVDEASSWESVMPRIDTGEQLRADLARFHEFLRCTNQIELLLRDAEIFAYEIVEGPHQENGFDLIRISEIPRQRLPSDFASPRAMAEFLEQERETGKRGANLVILSEPEDESLSPRRVEEPEHWAIVSISAADQTVTLRRARTSGSGPSAPVRGLLRTYGTYGQISLVRRRKKAIDRLGSHSFLLRSLSAPGQVYMDTGGSTIPIALDPEMVDEPKRAAIDDILRVRPIYSLQGPPGTGKTTLVAWLVREILADDPVAQILVTAQAHGAVDVLREKVAEEAYSGESDRQRPLAVRLRRDDADADTAVGVSTESDSVEGLALRILTHAKDTLVARPSLSEIERRWLASATDTINAIRSKGTAGAAPDFCELVKRGCHLIYCTTSAGELESLADMTLSFDWSIVEEAGKAHGFDLALPLQAGHRWLLIGDHKQLPPYRFEDYVDAVANLEAVVAALWALPERAGGLVDVEWLLSWRERSLDERAELTTFVNHWLKTFERVFEECKVARGAPQLTSGSSNGAAAGQIIGQHRMHPTIGRLISETYYDGALVNQTVDESGRPLPKVMHPFTVPDQLVGRAVVWLDLPAAFDGGPAEQGPAQGLPRYTNPAEVDALASLFASMRRAPGDTAACDLAVLSPYNRQVAALRRGLRNQLPQGVTLRPTRRRDEPDITADVAHSVDSFQGNQAHVIAVSLVRNNSYPAGQGLGFLSDPSRMNVLLSRAECLLILVGSFEFFKRQVALVDPDDRFAPLRHLRRVVDLMEEWFDAGDAVRLPADSQPVRR